MTYYVTASSNEMGVICSNYPTFAAMRAAIIAEAKIVYTCETITHTKDFNEAIYGIDTSIGHFQFVYFDTLYTVEIE